MDSIPSWSFLGTVPPPFGGVTVFTKRKIAHLRKQGKNVTLVDITRLGMLQKLGHFLRLALRGRDHGMYVNNLSGYYLAAALVNLRGARLFFHDHNYDLSAITAFRSWLLRRFLSRCEHVFFDGAHSRDNYIRRRLLSEEMPFAIASPFFPPDLEEGPAILASYPPDLFAFIKDHTPVVGANAFKIVLTEDGTDLYGLDMTVALLEKLRQISPDAGVVFAISVEEQSAYVQKVHQYISEAGLAEHFFFFTGTRELWPLFGKVDVMVRPTSTDGYGVSIAEALFVGTPAVASDVCVRPEGTVLFARRNQADFEEKVLDVLDLL